MGGCATKPKTLKDPVEAPEPAKEEVNAVSDAKEVVVVQEAEKKVKENEHEGGDKIKEIVEDDKVDDQGSNKRRSLSNLFKQNEERKESTETDDTPSETVKQEPSKAEKPEILVEEARSPSFVDALDKIETEKPIEDIPAVQTQTKETPGATKTEKAK